MTRSEEAHIRVHGVQPTQVLAAVVGLVYLVGGILGFLRTGFTAFTGNQHVLLIGFMINPLHNLVHVVVGFVGLLCTTTSVLSRTFGWLLFIGYGLLSAWGLMITGVITRNPVAGLGNPLNLNAADNWLHIATALLGLVMAIVPARKAIHVPTAAGPTSPHLPPAGTYGTTAVPSADDSQRRRRGSWFHRRHTAAP
ncbi:DUF4383 domain-containing protein [Amycolatopsis cynarae]|uniref:DUF4383 domain-containing protein n=1 Tax=Amycolatopsis cynarae TaxID=2995223 RepID=A0ABY7AYX1_9PSEU|nr:DUF4383 domain-containing protein [Amycolatopsis sp. HUAS 11-8]WAL64404.1 DUF4383 domain-containing protein [Amycolatopsis sp. HUAS 11-8]